MRNSVGGAPGGLPAGARNGSNWLGRAALTALGLAGAGLLRAETIPIPNGSFESPATAFVDIRIDSWQKTPMPGWWMDGPEWWASTTGVFLNTPAGQADHIENCDGSQAIFLYNAPEVGLFQDYDSTDWSQGPPSHAFDVRFEVGKSYRLTLGVIGGVQVMSEGSSLEVSLYYRNASDQMVVVAATNIVYTPAAFQGQTNLVDCHVQVPTVRAADAWAGQRMGIRLLSTVSFELASNGYWDLDNLRLTSTVEPALLSPGFTGSQFGFTLRSEPGLRFEIRASPDLSLPVSGWASLGTVTNTEGTVPFLDPDPAAGRRFYKALQL